MTSADTRTVGTRLSFPRNLVGSVAVASIAADRDVTITLTRGGVAVGTTKITKGAKTASFVCDSFALAPGKALTTGQVTRQSTLVYDSLFAFLGVTN